MQKLNCLTFFLLLFSWQTLANPPANVVIAPVSQQENSRSLELTGTINSAEHANLSSLIDGVVTQLHVETGDFVTKGQVLLALDDKLAQAQLQAIKAELQQAQVEFNEAKRRLAEAKSLSQQQLLPQTELEQRVTNEAVTQAHLAKITANYQYQQELVNRHQLVAPFAGVIVSRKLDVGEWVNRGQQTFELVNLQKLWLDLAVPQEYFARIDKDKTVMLELDNNHSTKISGKVFAKVPLVDSQNRSFLLRVELSQQAEVQVGLSARVAIPLKNIQQNVLTIPSDALLRHPDGGYSVFIASDNKAVRKSVVIGERIGEYIEILSGLSATDNVITEGNEMLKDQQAIQIKPSNVAGLE
ncbi:efflux RND transporter periplasmic adaptor subunit [Catenovulum sp. SX2]|uniref:efflux RND transporter periplasmic adaptor subunit n=1 Tax=Catenovulum sp. SX2 TaxID=3398614 RepID=UPI003F84F87D